MAAVGEGGHMKKKGKIAWADMSLLLLYLMPSSIPPTEPLWTERERAGAKKTTMMTKGGRRRKES